MFLVTVYLVPLDTSNLYVLVSGIDNKLELLPKFQESKYFFLAKCIQYISRWVKCTLKK